MGFRDVLKKIGNYFYNPEDPHCGGCKINCSLHKPNCHIGQDRAKAFFARHPELIRVTVNKVSTVSEVTETAESAEVKA